MSGVHSGAESASIPTEQSSDVSSLIKRLGAGERGNDLDVLIEIALFEPDDVYLTVRANGAGTKVIYGLDGGSEETCWAYDWTMYPNRSLAQLEELRSIQSGEV